MLILRQRLKILTKPDPHVLGGQYFVRSLYFDNLEDKALREKIDGVNRREKFRIRYYNRDPSFMHLEKKSKCSGLGSKSQALITAEEAQKIVTGETDWMMDSERPLVQELYFKMKSSGLRPKTIVDYTREPFVYDAGNVRLTLDYHIRTGLRSTDFLNPHCITVPVQDDPAILEVKWDGFLPAVIRSAIQLKGRRASAFSKYALCRMYD